MKRHKAFRLKNKKYRNAARKRNYHRGRPVLKKDKRRPSGVKHHEWTPDDDYLILDHDVKRLKGFKTDRALAEHLETSVQAIQTRRYKLKNADKR